MPTLRPLKERFFEKIMPEPNTGCWLWTDFLNKKGYGFIHIPPRSMRLAHRVSYEIHKGSITNGLLVCHHCDTPCCVNPDHLFLGTNDDNMADKVLKNRHLKTGIVKSKYSDDLLISLIKRHRQGEKVYRLALEFNIAPSYLSYIVKGEARKHLQNQDLLK